MLQRGKRAQKVSVGCARRKDNHNVRLKMQCNAFINVDRLNVGPAQYVDRVARGGQVDCILDSA